MASRTVRSLALLPMLALSACAGGGGLDIYAGEDNFGEANRQTFAAQVINPSPVYDAPYIAGSAEKAGQAIERYRTDRVKKPERLNLSSVGRAGGGAPAGGGN